MKANPGLFLSPLAMEPREKHISSLADDLIWKLLMEPLAFEESSNARTALH